jgi:DNA-binding CsgD family transcriptional regulator
LEIIFDAIQFIETSLLFCAFLFSAVMFVRTHDNLAGRNLMVLFPVSTVVFISYMYALNERTVGADVHNIVWLSPLVALGVVAFIMLSILATCYYVIQLFPVTAQKKRLGLIWSAILVGLLLIVTAILVMYMSKMDLANAVRNVLWAFYPLCSIALFIEAIALLSMMKTISNPHDRKLARYFLIAFLPQLFFSAADFWLIHDISFQLTHISYATFSLFAFVDLCAYFFSNYGRKMDITDYRLSLKEKYELSDRELEVLELLAKGDSNNVIGERLHISVNTVKSHIKRIYAKLGISSRLQLMNLLSGNGFNGK